MVNITTTLSNFSRLSFIGKPDKLLAADVIATPGQRMFGAEAGPDRDLLVKIFTPSAELTTAVGAIIDQHKPQPAGYPVPGLMAVLLKKGSMELEEADLGAVRLKNLILSLGMPGDLLEEGVADLMHVNPNKPSSSKAHFHILCALLAAMARLSLDQNIFASAAFLEDFPPPTASDEEQDGEGETKSQDEGDEGRSEGRGGDDQGDGHDGEQEEVQFAGTRMAPRHSTLSPPLFDRSRPFGGASGTRPSSMGQVGLMIWAIVHRNRVIHWIIRHGEDMPASHLLACMLAMMRCLSLRRPAPLSSRHLGMGLPPGTTPSSCRPGASRPSAGRGRATQRPTRRTTRMPSCSMSWRPCLS